MNGHPAPRRTLDAKQAAGFGPHDHLCWVYRDEPDWVAAAARFLADGAAGNDKLLYVADKPEPALIDDLAGLPGRDAMLESGQLEALPLSHGYLRGGEFSGERRIEAHRAQARAATEAGYRALRLAADASELVATIDQVRRFTEYELLLDGMMARTPMTTLCGYGAGRVDPTAARMLSFVHPAVNHGDHRPAASMHASRGDGWRLTGEIDLAVGEELELALGAVPGDSDVHLEVDELEFLDVAGASALVALARRLEPDRRLVVHRPSPVVRRVLELGWPELPENLRLTT